MTFGIDVSGYQSGIDYTQARKEGVEFVIIKAAGFNIGTLYSADGYHGHVDAARQAGLCIGHYYVVGEGDPEMQADFLADNLHDFDPDHDVLALDDEPLDRNATYWRQTEALRFFTRLQERTGIPWDRLWLYCPASLTRSNGPWDKITGRGIRIWWSAYGNSPIGHQPDHTPALNGKIDRWDIHQYSSSVSVAGRRTIDANYSNIPCAELFGGAVASAPASSTPASVEPSGGEHRYTSTEEDGIPGAIFYGRVQTLGKERGIYSGVIDGVTGPLTETARIKLTAQACNGWKNGPHTTTDRDGIPGKNYWTAVQEIGKAQFGYAGIVDGIPGPFTYATENRICAHELNTHR